MKVVLSYTLSYGFCRMGTLLHPCRNFSHNIVLKESKIYACIRAWEFRCQVNKLVFIPLIYDVVISKTRLSMSKDGFCSKLGALLPFILVSVLIFHSLDVTIEIGYHIYDS